MTKPVVVNNQIIYADHVVTFDIKLYEAFASADDAQEALSDMADNLSEEGSLIDHVEELDAMNNDGSWTAAFLKPEYNTLVLKKEQAAALAQALSHLNNLGASGNVLLTLPVSKDCKVTCDLDLDGEFTLRLESPSAGKDVKETFSSQATFTAAYGLN